MHARESAIRLAEAFRLLQAGHAADALALTRPVVEAAPSSARARHMLALCLKACGNDAHALHAFESARKLGPHDPDLLSNFGNFLCQLNRHRDALPLYREALTISPAHCDAWRNLAVALLALDDPRAARVAFERATQLRPGAVAAWQGLGSACRRLGDLEGAERALQHATEVAPGSGSSLTALGVVRRLLGNPEAAIECYRAARAVGFAGPEIDDAEASALLDLGDVSGALKGARRLTSTAPDYVAGHEMLAHILWEYGQKIGQEADPLDAFRRAVKAQPEHRALGLAYLRFLFDSGADEAALEQVESLRQTGSEPELLALEAALCDRLGQGAKAARIFQQALEGGHRDTRLLNLYIRHLLGAGLPDAAAAHALDSLERAPHDQVTLAYLSLAWRLLDDPREQWLCGYESLVREIEVQPPPGGAKDSASFLAELEAALLPMHQATREPLSQSVRHGSQTAGVLLGRNDATIRATREAISQAISEYLRVLPVDTKHPFLSRKSARVRFAGSWSVCLRSSGSHVNHMHPEGWLSSAFYVALPPNVTNRTADGNAGWIKFGEPPSELALGLGPRRMLQPRPGWLVLFPSYLWHGTVPFADDAHRLTIAFDAQPTY